MSWIEAQDDGCFFYGDPTKQETWSGVDPMMRRPVELINRSGWVWTMESCQGHPDAKTEIEMGGWGRVKPFLVVAVREQDLGRMLGLLALAMQIEGAGRYVSVPFTIATYRAATVRAAAPLDDRGLLAMEAKGDWIAVVIETHATNVFQRDQGIAALVRFGERLSATA